jgi:hypothetical protein
VRGKHRNSYGLITNESALSSRVRGMVAMRRGGNTYALIGKRYGISRQRVHQLLEDFDVATGIRRPAPRLPRASSSPQGLTG